MSAYPDFLCIGAQKAGTTWLHAILKLHPDIWLPERKEIHYFDHKYPPYLPYPDKFVELNNIKRYEGNKLGEFLTRMNKYSFSRLMWETHYRLFPRNDNWYRRLFVRNSSKITGDFTPAYALLSDAAISHVHGLMPDAKVIFIMRNPIDRAWSHAKMILGQHGLRKMNQIGIDEFKNFLVSEQSRLRCKYTETLDRWGSFYRDDQILVLFFDDIVKKPQILMRSVVDFLVLDGISSQMYDVLNRAVHKGQEKMIPGGIFKLLYGQYEREMEILASRYGEIPELWLKEARNQLNEV